MIKYLYFLIYPLILFVTFFLIYRKYKLTIIENLKYIIINTILISTIICIGMFVYFRFENTIYSYDYAGHWIRALEMKGFFINEPNSILSKLYYSMNNLDYSYLPALFIFPILLIKESYSWFCICIYIFFLLPSIVLLQIIYFKKTNLNKYLPILLSIIFYPLYLNIFYGKVDACGMFFILASYLLIIFPDIDDIDIKDNIIINLFAFLSIFLRRWYLYSVVCLYIVYLLKIVFFKKKEFKYYRNYLISCIPLAIIMFVFFKPFIFNSLNNNFENAYSFYNQGNKVLGFIDYLSPIVIVVSFFGIYRQFKNNKYFLLTNLLSIILPCILVWRIQNLEYHHFYIFLINVIFLFISGLIQIKAIKNIINYIVLIFMTVQSLFIYTNAPRLFPLFTNTRNIPETIYNKEELIDLSNFIKSIEPDKDTSAYLCGGSYGIISDDLLRNAQLPSLDMPNIDSSVFDLRDGFPRDLQFIRYVILIDPILYMDEDYQHMYTVINNAILNEPLVSNIYNKINSFKINEDYTAVIYEKTGDFTPEIKQYFYNQMISYYPDYKEEFKYILE